MLNSFFIQKLRKFFNRSFIHIYITFSIHIVTKLFILNKVSQFSNLKKNFTIFEMSKQHRRRRNNNVKLFDFKQNYMNVQKRFAIENQSQTLFDDVFRIEKSIDVINDSNSKKQSRTKFRRTKKNFIISNSIFQSQQITSFATKKKNDQKSQIEKKNTILESIQKIIDDEFQTFIKIVDINVKSHIEL